MSLTVTYSHAAPYIRERMCRHAYDSLIARTQKERAKHINWMFGLREALEIMGRAGDCNVEPGIAEEKGLPLGAVILARHYLADAADRLFGEEHRTQCAETSVDAANPTHRCLFWAEEGQQVCRRHRGSTATVPTPEPPAPPSLPHIPQFR